jgi:hypothetical protein
VRTGVIVLASYQQEQLAHRVSSIDSPPHIHSSTSVG